jgi:hypothetical protein
MNYSLNAEMQRRRVPSLRGVAEAIRRKNSPRLCVKNGELKIENENNTN